MPTFSASFSFFFLWAWEFVSREINMFSYIAIYIYRTVPQKQLLTTSVNTRTLTVLHLATVVLIFL